MTVGTGKHRSHRLLNLHLPGGRSVLMAPKSSKRRHSSQPTSDDLKSLDDKWSERFSRLEALLLNKSFAVPVKPVNPSTVVTRKHPFFDPGASSSVVSAGLVT